MEYVGLVSFHGICWSSKLPWNMLASKLPWNMLASKLPWNMLASKLPWNMLASKLPWNVCCSGHYCFFYYRRRPCTCTSCQIMMIIARATRTCQMRIPRTGALTV